ncbi:isopentenyl-diphosphate Delta-isomerase [Nocardioides sp. HDW12B]|uniref:isopentenyl-diphosphate Delta-isomerase n=1 Tax=Nocardioides sp. HDW12B TaxID=2714939 RepID=UPI00140F14B6|nr:isopentenyl-diphosphate Delta-isomerase [Nocardioides sp. HDW12B]QIK65997.1 isopentenyl-diphosphate Delta-isomerase [Nocardioides sp. HDW12B]
MTPGTSADLALGYRRCARLTRRHGTTYAWGARLLAPEDRKHVHAVYGLARTADDIVDHPGHRSHAEVATALTAYETSFFSALASGASDDPVLLAAATTARERGIEADCFARFFAAMRADLTTTSYATWDDLLGYMDGSAAVIGEMMLPVLRAERPTPAVRDAARALGLAFQLTNFLRDVGEDLDRGRVYVPQEDLDHFGADPSRRTVDEPWRALMRFEIARNRRLYREADEGLAALPLRARRCVSVARVLYAQILERIEERDLDVFSGRARVPTARKAATAARLLRSPEPSDAVWADRTVHPPAAPGWPDDDPVVLLDRTGNAVGQRPKSQTHHDDTPLHLGFSCYVVDPDGRVLVTTRAHDKASFPGVVTNSACGHPRPGESLESAVRRRVRRELGLEVGDVRLVLADFAYRARTDLLAEHELCPVVVARCQAQPDLTPHPGEVATAQWWSWSDLRDRALTPQGSGPGTVSPWCREQVAVLQHLGDDPRTWPEADARDLPPAVHLRDEVPTGG